SGSSRLLRAVHTCDHVADERTGERSCPLCRNGRNSQMAKVIFDMSMSLDGYMTASGVRPEEPMGDGGQQLHSWAVGTGDARSAHVLAEMIRTVGAGIAGRRTYDMSVRWWGADGPSGPSRTPLIVVSHGKPKQVPKGGVYMFVQSPEEAVK